MNISERHGSWSQSSFLFIFGAENLNLRAGFRITENPFLENWGVISSQWQNVGNNDEDIVDGSEIWLLHWAVIHDTLPKKGTLFFTSTGAGCDFSSRVLPLIGMMGR